VCVDTGAAAGKDPKIPETQLANNEDSLPWVSPRCMACYKPPTINLCGYDICAMLCNAKEH